MRKEYVLINNEKYKMIMSFEEIDFDYYTDVCVELIFDKKKIILIKDNLLALKNIVDRYDENIDSLDEDLDENKLGILLNDYYLGTYEDQFKNSLKLDEEGNWTGEKYCCFLGMEYATWIYKKDENIILKVTPVFGKFEDDDYAREYEKFAREYKDVFRKSITRDELMNMKNTVLKVYEAKFHCKH